MAGCQSKNTVPCATSLDPSTITEQQFHATSRLQNISIIDEKSTSIVHSFKFDCRSKNHWHRMYRSYDHKLRAQNKVIGFFFLSQIVLGYFTADAFVIRPSPTGSLLRLSVVSDFTDLEQKTVIQLKDELRSQGLPVSGTKAKLIQRLIENSSNAEETTNETASGKQTTEKDVATPATPPLRANIDPDSVIRLLPPPLLTTLAKRTESNDAPSLLPVQELAYKAIATGGDAVLHAPTGSGKTLGYVLPLFAQLLEWKKNGILKRKRKRRLKSDEYFAQKEPSTPALLVIVPSRELAKQVGKICSQYHPTSSNRVTTVFGGVPLERHSSILRFKELDVIVGTPGRIRELIREEFLDLSEIKAIVLDEADVLLNFDDQPEIEMILNGMKEDYQLVLASATVNRLVKDFVKDVMEMDVSDDSFVTISNDDDAGGSIPSSNTSSKVVENALSLPTSTTGSNKRPTVSHWYTAARASARSGLAADIVATLNPRIGIMFVASKVEADTVAEEISARLSNVRVSVLHGDMSQSARSRTVAALRDNERTTASRILVATDVASRGLDLPGVDLVLQFGIPRQSGKEGTFDAELYTHRSGRAGRVGGGSRPADAILLFDPGQGEARILPSLQEELADDFGLFMKSRPLPSPRDVLEASYDRSFELCKDIPDDELFDFFRGKVQSDMNHILPSNREEELLRRLSAAMAALSGLDGTVPERSLLTADPRDRTLRVWSEEGEALTPPEVTRFAKGLGSGKLGRVTICDDGSAVFDLVEKRALRVIKTFKEQDSEKSGSTPNFQIELPSVLP